MSTFRSTRASLVPLAVALLAPASFAQATERVSVDPVGAQANSASMYPAISGDGNVVAFWSFASNLVPGDTNGAWDIFVRELATGATARVPAAIAQSPFPNMSELSLSADGRLLLFGSDFAWVPADTNGKADVYLYDRVSASYELVSVGIGGALGNDGSGPNAISADGSQVVFTSSATNLVAGDTNGEMDVFVRDRSAGVTERVSVDSSGAQANDFSYSFKHGISADGRIVGFTSAATNLVPGDTNNEYDSFVHDRVTGVTERVSVSSAGVAANDSCGGAMPSADGRFVLFESNASNLVAGDTNGLSDAFVRDRANGTTERVSVGSGGTQCTTGGHASSISDDGRIIAFYSFEMNLVPGDTNPYLEPYVHDRETAITSLAHVDSSGVAGDQMCHSGELCANGLDVVMASNSTNLVAGDTNLTSDVFVHQRCSIDATWANYGAGLAGTLGVPAFTARADPRLGTTVTLDLGNSLGAATTCFLIAGTSQAAIPFKGGTLLVGNWFAVVTLPIAAGGTTLDVEIPNDAALGGVAFDGQLLELDPGAVKGLSFSAGLELILGR